MPYSSQRIRAQVHRMTSDIGQKLRADETLQADRNLQRATIWPNIAEELITPGKKSAGKPSKHPENGPAGQTQNPTRNHDIGGDPESHGGVATPNTRTKKESRSEAAGGDRRD